MVKREVMRRDDEHNWTEKKFIRCILNDIEMIAIESIIDLL